MKQLRVAIIGCGAIAKKRHALACDEMEGVSLVGVCDVSLESAEALAQKYGAKAFSDIDEMLDCTSPDCVCVCTPAGSHAAISSHCLQKGMDVLCEKPMATNAEDAKEMMRVSQATGKRLMVAFSNRAYTEHRLMKELLQAGRIGKPLMFKTSLEDPGVENLIGCDAGEFYDRMKGSPDGAMNGMGCHRVDLIRYLFDSPIAEIFSCYAALDKRYSNGEPIDVDDTALAIMKLENGVVGTFSTSWCNYGPGELGTEIYGTRGLLRYRGEDKVELWNGKDCETFSYHKDLAEKNGHGIVRNFLSACMGKEEPITICMDGVECMMALEASARSAKAGAWARIK